MELTEKETTRLSKKLEEKTSEITKLKNQLEQKNQQEAVMNEGVFRYNLLIQLIAMKESINELRETLKNGINAIGLLLSNKEEIEEIDKIENTDNKMRSKEKDQETEEEGEEEESEEEY